MKTELSFGEVMGQIRPLYERCNSSYVRDKGFTQLMSN